MSTGDYVGAIVILFLFGPIIILWAVIILKGAWKIIRGDD